MGSQCRFYNHGRHDDNDARTNDHRFQEQNSSSNRYHSKFIYHSESHSDQHNNHHYQSNKRDHESDYQHPQSNYQHSKTDYQHSGSNSQHSKMDYQLPESNDQHSELNNDDPVINNDDGSSEEEEVEEVSDSESLEEDLEEQKDGEASFPEIMPYSYHRRRYNRKRFRGSSQRIKYSHVTLPSGKHATISSPKVSGWKCGMKTKLIKLKPNGHLGRKEYKIVADEMRNTIRNKQNFFCLLLPNSPLCSSNLDIIKIQKIVNGCIWDKYRDYQKQVYQENHHINERMLFHGTPKAKQLLRNGFDERMSSMHGLFGAGIYFAQHAGKSDKYVFGLNGGCKKHNNRDCTICIRHMLLCRVTLGNVEKLSIPKSFPHAPPGKHSVQGVPGIALDYPEHIVYRGEQAYPEYLISYKKK